jgi:hypothetical protein
MADQLRDEAIRLATVELPGRFRAPDAEDKHLLAQIDTRVALARLLRDDAEAMRLTMLRAAEARRSDRDG